MHGDNGVIEDNKENETLVLSPFLESGSCFEFLLDPL